MTKLKIGINGFFLCRPYTGIATYLKSLLEGLKGLDKKNEYFIFVPENYARNFLNLTKNFKIIILPFSKLPTLSLKKWFWERYSIPAAFKKQKINIAFFPYPSNPPQKILAQNKIKSIVTVHDLIPWKYYGEKRKFRSIIYNYFARKRLFEADQIITVSNETKKELIKFLIPANKITVIHNFLLSAPTVDNKNIKKTEKFNKPYFFYLGGFAHRKNVDRLIKNFKIANKDDKFSLILGGGTYLGDLNKNKTKNIIYTGFLTDTKKEELFKNCHTFINISLMEGFNLPLLEAAQAKKLIITSNLKVHYEVLGKKGAIYVNPQDDQQIINVIELAMKFNIRNKNKFIAEATKHIKKFDYRKESQKFLNLLHQLVFSKEIN